MEFINGLKILETINQWLDFSLESYSGEQPLARFLTWACLDAFSKATFAKIYCLELHLEARFVKRKIRGK